MIVTAALVVSDSVFQVGDRQMYQMIPSLRAYKIGIGTGFNSAAPKCKALAVVAMSAT